MKCYFNKTILIALLALGTQTLFAQFNLNQGATKSKNYHIELPYQLSRGLMIVSIEINQKPHRFLFDTGAPLLIYGDLKKEFNLSKVQCSTLRDSQGNVDSTFIGIVDKIMLENIAFEGVGAIFKKPDFISSCVDFEGIIGSNLLRNSIIQFDTERKVIIITDVLEKLNLDKKDATKMLLDNQSSPFFISKVGTKKQVEMITLFDSGFAGSFDFPTATLPEMIKKETYSDTMIAYGSTAVGVGGREKPNQKHKVTFTNFEINNGIITNWVAESSSDKNAKVGLDILKYGKVTIDYIHKKFYFTPNAPIQASMEKSWPISIAPQDDKLLVVIAWGKANQEVKISDEVVSIDNEAVKIKSTCDYFLNSLMRNRTEATLSLKRKDGTIYQKKIMKQ